MEKYNIAVVGASGAVGEELFRVLEEVEFPIGELLPLASARSAGADIEFKDGFIECKKLNMETAGLALLWPVEGFGKVLLPTTCLPKTVKTRSCSSTTSSCRARCPTPSRAG